MAGKNGGTVGNYVTLQRGTTYSGMLVGSPGPALLGLGSIEPGGGFREGHYKTYGGECPEKLMLYPGDIYVSLKGATKDGSMIGSVARVPPTVKCGRLTQDTVKLAFRDPSPALKQHIYWVLRTPHYRDYCASRATGSAQVGLSREDFLAYPIPPVTAVTKKLGDLLEATEGKIELNRRMNETLEAMARAIFKSWFVDFDPVRAKMDGRKPAGMDSATTSLFTDSFEDSELGPIPRGWNVSSIGEIVKVVGGSTPSTSNPIYWGGDIHFVTPKDMSSITAPILLDTERKITEAGLRCISSGLLPIGTVLLSSRAPIGYTAITDIPVAVNQGFIAMICNGELPNYFVLHLINQNMDLIIGNANGTTFLEISKSNFRPIPVIVPSHKVLEMFVNIAGSIYKRILSNLRESCTLATLRDALLPKLLTGQLDMNSSFPIVRD
jgi:type I restriction enzyme S subunit